MSHHIIGESWKLYSLGAFKQAWGNTVEAGKFVGDDKGEKACFTSTQSDDI